ncbi:hypothetical protein [Mesorhizobium sp. 43Arga]
MLHTLAKRRDGRIGREGIHGEFLSLKELHDQIAASLKTNAGHAISQRGAPPAKRIRACGAKLPFAPLTLRANPGQGDELALEMHDETGFTMVDPLV